MGLKKGGVILARRKWRVDSAWSRGNVKQMWFPAEILKIRPGATDEKDSYDVITSYTALCIVWDQEIIIIINIIVTMVIIDVFHAYLCV